MTYVVPLMPDITVTPVFKHITVEDVPASEREGHAVMKSLEVVEVRFAGSKLFSPVFPVNAQWQRKGHQIVTYAERWADQYAAFVTGTDQKAAGTPLEMLKPYGISDAQLSLCRALRIYSIEAMHSLEGPALKSLQMNAGPMKDMAARYMADRHVGGAASDRIAALEAQIEALKAAQVPKQDSTAAEIAAALVAAGGVAEVVSKPLDDMTDAELKALIKEKSGQAPRGTPSREWLLSAVKELAA